MREMKPLSLLHLVNIPIEINAILLHGVTVSIASCNLLGFSTNTKQYKYAKIAKFALDIPLERNWTCEVCNLNI